MRWKMILALFALCAMLFAAGWMALETEKLEQECSVLETEIMLLEFENAQLRERLEMLQEEKAAVFGRLQRWFDVWETGEFEVTAYTLECGNGDGLTATMTVPREGHTIAVDPAVLPLGSKVFIPGLGWRVAEDVGGLIRGRAIDIYMGSGIAARGEAMRWGRKNVKVVYRK